MVDQVNVKPRFIALMNSGGSEIHVASSKIFGDMTGDEVVRIIGGFVDALDGNQAKLQVETEKGTLLTVGIDDVVEKPTAQMRRVAAIEADPQHGPK